MTSREGDSAAIEKSQRAHGHHHHHKNTPEDEEEQPTNTERVEEQQQQHSRDRSFTPSSASTSPSPSQKHHHRHHHSRSSTPERPPLSTSTSSSSIAAAATAAAAVVSSAASPVILTHSISVSAGLAESASRHHGHHHRHGSRSNSTSPSPSPLSSPSHSRKHSASHTTSTTSTTTTSHSGTPSPVYPMHTPQMPRPVSPLRNGATSAPVSPVLTSAAAHSDDEAYQEFLDQPSAASMREMMRNSNRYSPADSNVKNTISDMQTSGDVFILCKNKGPLKVNVKLSHDKHYLVVAPVTIERDRMRFTVVSGYPKLVLLDHIHELLQGQYHSSFAKCRLQDKLDCSFSIICKNIQFDLVADSKEKRVIWVAALEHLVESGATPMVRFVDSAWRSENLTWINFEQTNQLLLKLNFKPSKSSLKSRFAELAVSKPGFLNFGNFRVLVYALLRRKEIAEIFGQFSSTGGSTLTTSDLISFHQQIQQDMEFNEEDAEAVMRRFGDNQADLGSRVVPTELFLHEFEGYLLSKHNSIFRPDMGMIHQDMTAPLSFYYIRGCRPLTSMEETFRFLKRGAGRYLEVSCYEGKEDDFKEVLKLVKEYAFTINMFPLILHLHVHGSPASQSILAQAISSILEDIIAKPLCMEKPDLKFLPSPTTLRGQVLLMGKVDQVVDAIGKHFFLHTFTPETFPSDLNRVRPWDVLCIGEKDFSSYDAVRFVEHTRKFMTQVHAQKKTHGFDPTAAWAAGVQITSVDPDDEISAPLAEGKFMQNGSCGYLRKQWFMTADPVSFEDCVTYTSPEEINTVHKLSIQVLSARVLPKLESESRTVDPYVQIEVCGNSEDYACHKTKPIHTNGFNPDWIGKCAPFEFHIAASSHALLFIRVMDLGSRQLAYYTLPVNCIRPGLRVVHLKSLKTKLPAPCTLTLRINVFANPSPKYPLCEQLEKIPPELVEFGYRQQVVASISGPDDESDSGKSIPMYGIYGRGITTYPIDRKTKVHLGSPICDRYHIAAFHDRLAYCIADGCNWGNAPREAAIKVTNTFIRMVSDDISYIKTTKDAGFMMARGLICGNRSISEGMQIGETAGTTTFLGGVLLPFPKTTESGGKGKSKWCSINLSLGDCKIFCWRSRENELVDIGGSARYNLDSTDPGGRLGPYRDFLKPDMRNFRVTHAEVFTGDLLLLMSDGVHDNFEPSLLGIRPKDVDPALADFPTWEAACKAKSELTMGIAHSFMINGLTAKIRTIIDEHGANPEMIVNSLLEHCVATTQSSREFVEENPKQKLPSDYTMYPGKLDHTTCEQGTTANYSTPMNPSANLVITTTIGYSGYNANSLTAVNSSEEGL
ncbi:1-phosphatidylinositol 4,5-bisphosphate phosphodiesterase delta-4 [Pelomyxa schiedti]|nr:1-phosphatidylinositol 4,5-bisphosphate phosphodiesterase delta-4 [Pelomyxa schiedti]